MMALADNLFCAYDALEPQELGNPKGIVVAECLFAEVVESLDLVLGELVVQLSKAYFIKMESNLQPEIVPARQPDTLFANDFENVYIMVVFKLAIF